MEQDITTIDGDFEQQQPNKIPVFLKVLCILTFVGSGLGILGALINLTGVNADETVQAMSQLTGDAFNVDDYLKWSQYSNIVNLVTALMGLGGALLMWRLNKVGFYLYTGSWVISFGFSIVAMEHIMIGPASGFTPAVIAFNGLIMVAFLVMYGVNLKHMK